LFSTLGSGDAAPRETTRTSACGAVAHRKRISLALSSAWRAWMVRRRPDRLREEEGAEASSPAWGVPGAVVPEPEDIFDVTPRAIATGRFVSAAPSTSTPPAQISASDLAAPAFARAAVGRRGRERRRR
jgi:hypothetical protein